MSGRLISPKTWDRIVGIFGTALGSPGTDYVVCPCGIIYAINYGLGVVGSEMAMDFGSTK